METRTETGQAPLPGLEATCSLIFSSPIVTPISLGGLTHLLDVIRLQATTIFQGNTNLVRKSIETQKERQREEALHDAAQELTKLLAVQTRSGEITEDGKAMLAALYTHLGTAIRDGLSLVSLGGNMLSLVRPVESNWFTDIVLREGTPMDGSMVCYKDGLAFNTFYRMGIPFLTEVEIADPEKEKEGDHIETDFASLSEAELTRIIEEVYKIMGPQTVHQLPMKSGAEDPQELDILTRSVAKMGVKAKPEAPEEPASEGMGEDQQPSVEGQSSDPEPNPFKMRMLEYLAGTMKDLPVDVLAHASDEDMLRIIHQHCTSKGMKAPAPGEPIPCHKRCQDQLEIPLEGAGLATKMDTDEGLGSYTSFEDLFEDMEAEVPTPDSGIGKKKAFNTRNVDNDEQPMLGDNMSSAICDSIEEEDEFDISQVDGPGDEPPPRKQKSGKPKPKKSKGQDPPICGMERPMAYKFTNPRVQQAKRTGGTAHVHLGEASTTAGETYRKWMDLLSNPYEEGNLTPRKKRILQWEQEEQIVAIHKYLRLPSSDISEETKATKDALWSKIADMPRCMDCVEKHKYTEPCVGHPKTFNGHASNTTAYFYYYPPHVREAGTEDEQCTRCFPIHGSDTHAQKRPNLYLILPVWDAGLLSILPHCGAWTPVTAFDEVEGKVTTTYLHHELVNNRHCFYLNRPSHAAPFDPVIRTIQAILPHSKALREVPEYDLLSEVMDYQAKILEEIMKCDKDNNPKAKESEEALSGIAIIFSEDLASDKGESSPEMEVCGEDELPDIPSLDDARDPSHSTATEQTALENDPESSAMPPVENMDIEEPEIGLIEVEVITTPLGSPVESEADTVIPVYDGDFLCGWCRSMTHSWQTCKELTDVMEQLDIVDKNIRQEEENAKVGLCETPDESTEGPLSLKTFRSIIKRRQRRRDPGTEEEIPKFLTRKVEGVPLLVQIAIEEQLNAIHALCVEPTERKELLPFDSPLVERLINPLLCMSCWDNHAVGDPCADYKKNTLYQNGEDPWICVRVLYPLLAGQRGGCTHAFADFRVLDGGYFNRAVENDSQWSERCTLLRKTPVNSRMIYTRNRKNTKADFYVLTKDNLKELRAVNIAEAVEQSPSWSYIAQITASPLELEYCMKKQLTSILQLSCLEDISNRDARSLTSFMHSPYICLQCGSRHADDDMCTWNVPLLQSGARFSRTIRVRHPTRVGLNSQLLELTDITGAEFATFPIDETKAVASLTQEYEIVDGGAFAPCMTDRMARTIMHRFNDEKGDKVAVMVMTKPNCFEIEVADSLTDLQLQWFRGNKIRASTIPQLDAVMPRTLTLLSQLLRDQKRRNRPYAQPVRRASRTAPVERPPAPPKPNREGWKTPEILNPDVLDLLSPLDPTDLDVEEVDNEVFPPPLPTKQKNKKLWVNVVAANRLRDSKEPSVQVHDTTSAPTASITAEPIERKREEFYPLKASQEYLLEGIKDVPRLDRLHKVAREMERSSPSRDLSLTRRRQVKRHVINERRRLDASRGRIQSAKAVSKKAKLISHLPSLYTYPPEDVRGDIVIIPLGREIRSSVPNPDFVDTPFIGPATVDAVLHQQLDAIHELCRDVPIPEERAEHLRNMIRQPVLCVHCLQNHPIRLPLCSTVIERSSLTPVRRGLAPTKRHVRVTWCDSHYSLPKELCQGCQKGDCPVDGQHEDNRGCNRVVFTLVDGGAIDRMMNSATYQETWRYRRQTDPNTGEAQNTVMCIRWHPHATYNFPLTSSTKQPFETEILPATPTKADSPTSPPPEGSKEQQELEFGAHIRNTVDKMQIAPPDEDIPHQEVKLSLKADYADLSRQIEAQSANTEPIRFSITVRERDAPNASEDGPLTEQAPAQTTSTGTNTTTSKVPEWYVDPSEVDSYVQREDMEKLISVWKQKGVVRPTTLSNPGGLFNLRPDSYRTSAVRPPSRFCTACRRWHAMVTGTCTMDQFITFERSRATPEYTSLPAEIKLMILKDRFARFHKHAYQLDTPEAKRPRDPAYRQVFTSLWVNLPLNAQPCSFLDDLIDEAYNVPPGFTSCRRDDVIRWKAGPSGAQSPWDHPQRYDPPLFRPRGACRRVPTYPRQNNLNRLRHQSRAWPKPRFNSCTCWGQRRESYPHGW